MLHAPKNKFLKLALRLTVVLILLQVLVAPAQASGWREQGSVLAQVDRGLSNVLTPMRHAQKANDNPRAALRSRNEVMQEIKRRYDARVLKIFLNRKREMYNVRILLPNGKVRNLQVSARR